MKHLTSLLLLFLTLWTASCTTPRNVAYFQNAAEIRGMALQPEQPLRLRPGDKINIVVNSSDPLLVQQFNLSSSTQMSRSLGASVSPQTLSGKNSGGSTSLMLAYTVDEQGDISFPVLGKVPAQGKTRQEMAVYLQNRLINRDLVKDPIVTVEFVNLCVNVLGEVNRPGRIDILLDKFTILDAIALAGDLTINGQRENVMVCREIDGEDHTFFINLCDRQEMLSSPAFYLQQNDVVYVTPTPKRQREANSTGNAFSQPALWLSVASLLTTLGALLIK